MIEFDEAVSLALEKAPGPIGTETISIYQSVGRILALDLKSDVNLPPFDRSGMDGFAVRSKDLASLPVKLKVVMDIPAGITPEGTINSGEAASIMTGAPVPEGADCVVQVEWTSGFGASDVIVNKVVERGKNVSPLGEITQIGQVVLRAGTVLSVEEIGLAAAVGCDPVTVYLKPRVAILSTGDEVVAPSQTPGASQIRDVNGPATASFVRTLGLEPVLLGCVKDNQDSLRAAVEQGLEYDCLLLSGGVSAGAYDFVEDVLDHLGVEVFFRRSAVKPGKPTVFGTRGDRMVVGLPGNPASSMVISRLLVAPALRKMMGHQKTETKMIKARLTSDIRKKPNRRWYLYGDLVFDKELTVCPLNSKGSADLLPGVSGNCLILAEKGLSQIDAGTFVDVVIWERSL